MKKHILKPLAAFDILPDSVRPITDDWPTVITNVGYRWLHLKRSEPSVEAWIKSNLPTIAGRTLLQAETRPRCDRLDDGLLLNLRAVNLNPKSAPEDMVSLRMWVTKDGIISTRGRKVYAADALKEAALAGNAPLTVGAFIADLIHNLTDRIEKISIELEDRTDDLEEHMLEGAKVDTAELADLRQGVLRMRRFINPQREALSNLATIKDWIFSKGEIASLRESSNRTRRIIEELDAAKERLASVQDKLDADHANAIGRNSYLLSIIAAIFLPLTFFTGLFGVNVGGMPGLDSPSAFWVLTATSIIGGILLYLVFKLAKWL